MLRKFCNEVICFSGLFVLLLKLRIMGLLLERFKLHATRQIQKIALKLGFFIFTDSYMIIPKHYQVYLKGRLKPKIAFQTALYIAPRR